MSKSKLRHLDRGDRTVRGIEGSATWFSVLIVALECMDLGNPPK